MFNVDSFANGRCWFASRVSNYKFELPISAYLLVNRATLVASMEFLGRVEGV